MVALPLRMQLSDDDFLTFDGPTGMIVAPDDTRENFYHHLGLRQDVYQHKAIYRRMKKEAKAGMARLFSNRKCLRPELAEDDSLVAPFSVNEISEIAFQEEVEVIQKKASRMTRSWYSMMDTGDGKNWVIRWMLWSVLRKAERTRVEESSSSEYSCALTMASTARSDSTGPLFSFSDISPSLSESHKRRNRSVSAGEDDERPRTRVKIESPLDSASPSRQSTFWSHVMNT